MKTENNSAVISYLEATYRLSCSTGGHSWRVINTAMQQALAVAITARFPFEKDDFSVLCRSNGGWPDNGYLGWYRWFSEGGENFYKLAIDSRNITAAISFEQWKGRKPFIFQKQRLYKGARFEWKPREWWYCNSFAEDGSYINCGSYQSEGNPMGWRGHSPLGQGPTKRMQLSAADLKAQEKRLREAA